MCGLAADGQYFSERKEITWYELMPATRMKDSRPESAPRHFPQINPRTSKPPDPNPPPQEKSTNVHKENKEIKPTPKQDETSHHKTYNTTRLKTEWYQRVYMEKPHHIKPTMTTILQNPLQLQGRSQQQVQYQRHPKMTDAVNSQHRSHVPTTRYMNITHIQ